MLATAICCSGTIDLRRASWHHNVSESGYGHCPWSPWYFRVWRSMGCSSIWEIPISIPLRHPKYPKHQIRLEIKQTMALFPEDCTVSGPKPPLVSKTSCNSPFFICFTDPCIYWIHQGWHHLLIYKILHKSDHKWIMPTPFGQSCLSTLSTASSRASAPYPFFPFILPLAEARLCCSLRLYQCLNNPDPDVPYFPLLFPLLPSDRSSRWRRICG